MNKPKNGMRPIHPGEVEEFLRPLDMSANRLAQAIEVPANRISELVKGDRAVTADTALRLSRAFNTTPEFWMSLQQAFELRTAEVELGARLRAIKPVIKQAYLGRSRSTSRARRR